MRAIAGDPADLTAASDDPPVKRHRKMSVDRNRELSVGRVTRAGRGRLAALEEFEGWNSIVTPSADAWPAIKARFPIGAKVAGAVVARRPFGVFLDLADGALGLIEAPACHAWRAPTRSCIRRSGPMSLGLSSGTAT